MNEMRTKLCGKFTKQDISKDIKACGWVATRRDHGGLIFVDLRDHSGIIQIVFEPTNTDAFALGEKLRPEYVIQVQGEMRERPADTANKNMPTGEIELVARKITLLNESLTPAFLPDDKDVTEDTRLEHRVMHIRSNEMQKNLRVRHQMSSAVRVVLNQEDFIDVETPMLTKSTPEGARDFLVPARNNPGTFYALPQSPQLFKQMLVAGGVDRYYQFARCFRDEDLRSSRQPEFTQIDIEMAFTTGKEVMQIGEQVANAAFTSAGFDPFEKIASIPYDEAMSKYGNDAPNLAIEGMFLVDIAQTVKDCGFKVFAAPAAKEGNRVVVLRAPNASGISRKQIDNLTTFVQKLGAGGLAYIKVNDVDKGVEGTSSPISKFLGNDTVNEILKASEAQSGDMLFFGAGPIATVNSYMGQLRQQLGIELDLVRPGLWPVWVVDFPLFIKEQGSNNLLSVHHPFTAPIKEDEKDLLAGNRLDELKSDSYDLVINGIELGGGSIRIHQANVQEKALEALDIDQQTANKQFGFLLNALKHGAPPHGGIAYGFDRMVAMAVGSSSIRDVIAFPKTQRGVCQFTKSPTKVSASQLIELGISLREQKS